MQENLIPDGGGRVKIPRGHEEGSGASGGGGRGRGRHNKMGKKPPLGRRKKRIRGGGGCGNSCEPI